MWVKSFACLFVHQYISSDCMVPLNPSSLPEAPVMSEAKGKWSLKKGLSTGVIVAIVIANVLVCPFDLILIHILFLYKTPLFDLVCLSFFCYFLF